MASPRYFADPLVPVAYYHCISRVVERRLAFGPEEKEQFVRLMRSYEGFCQVRVLSYCVMSNHFHIMVEVRKRPEGEVYSDAWLLKQAALIYSKPAVRMLKEALETFRSQGHDAAAEELKEKYLGRMWDVSQFMKELKQRFSLWFNKRENRKGTLWEERFTSVLLEGELATLSVMSAYIDLNPVRAGWWRIPKTTAGAAMRRRWRVDARRCQPCTRSRTSIERMSGTSRGARSGFPVRPRSFPATGYGSLARVKRFVTVTVRTARCCARE